MSAVTTEGATMAAKRHYKSMGHMTKGHQDFYNAKPSRRELEHETHEYMMGTDARRRMEYMDGMMIKEDSSSPSDMPLYSINKMYAMPPQGATPYLDDSIAGVDNQIRHDVMKMRENFALRKI